MKSHIDWILFKVFAFFLLKIPTFFHVINSDVPNGSALTQENLSLLSNKTSSLNLSEDSEGGGDNKDSQRSGVTSSSAP